MLIRCLTLIAVLALAGPAYAAKNAEVSIMDDQLLLNEQSTAAVDRHMKRFRRIGVDRLRVSAFWDQIAPAPGRRKKPSFNSANGNASEYTFDNLDRVVTSANRHGLDVLISITTPAPRWATGDPSRDNRQWKPDPQEFAAFVRAVAFRYANVADQYAVLNEPNQAGWLMPQYVKGQPYAPHHYRRLVRAAFPHIRGGDPTATILVGELASSGSQKRRRGSPIRPLAFMRAFGCVSRSFRKLRSGRCRNFKAARADAIGHHPYQFFSHPSRSSANRDDAGIGDGRRLLRNLDRLVRKKRLISARGGKLNVHYTEFGYQTDPPDPYAGIPLRRQDRYLQEAAYVAWRTPRVRGLNQFRLTDGPILPGGGFAAYSEFQSGLKFESGRSKPAYASFRNPFVATRRGFWGQVRPGGAHSVTLQRKRGKRWRKVASVRTNGNGYWKRSMKKRSGRYRYRWGKQKSDVIRIR